MLPSQRYAVKRIIRFYRDHCGKRYSIRFNIRYHERGSGFTLSVNSRWDGDANRLGALCTSHGRFWIGPRGGIVVASAYGGVTCKSEADHIAYMLDARTSHGTPQPPKRPALYTRRGTPSKTRHVWTIADENPGASRKEVLALCEADGINKHTAATQYGQWLRNQKRLGRR